MRDLRWSDVSEWFDPDDGALHDGCVVGVVPDAWRAVADFVTGSAWSARKGEGSLLVSPAEGFFVNFFEVPDEVVFDVHVGELQGQERLDLLSAFLREVGQAWGKPVALTFEGLDPAKEPYLHYDPVADGFVLDRR
ncbi:hypothetical protein JNUCC0626_36845 [Lentzea sp. JNUCC 0626]|uniref:hypothetical protein n=1 Tax=Lentzea sp. JNUCC 0626 TaxID=3367513 RepID=UPI0037496BBF